MDTTEREIMFFDLDDKPCGAIKTKPLPAGSVIVFMGRKFMIGGKGEYYSEGQAGEVA